MKMFRDFPTADTGESQTMSHYHNQNITKVHGIAKKKMSPFIQKIVCIDSHFYF